MNISQQISYLLNYQETQSKVDDLLAAGKKWEAIRAFYRLSNKEIFSRGVVGHGIDVYQIDWMRLFTPIEQLAWDSIRWRGLPLYPQYPVGGVFVDFGDPVKRVALECDGRQWHDKETDAERDRLLGEQGWTVYRVTGSECYRAIRDESEDELNKERLHDGLIDEMPTRPRNVDDVVGEIKRIHYA